MAEKLVFWCKNCNLPFRDDHKICSNCNNKGKELISDLRPVFARERALLKYFEIDSYESESVWTNSRSHVYFIDGEKHKLPPYKEYREHAEDLREFIFAQEDYLESLDSRYLTEYQVQLSGSRIKLGLLEQESFQFVKEVAEKYRRRTMMVSFSGGKDSTVVSSLVRRALSRENILHVFGDTGLEDVNTHQYVEDFLVFNPDVPFFRAKSEQDFWGLVDHMGPPSRVMRWCCTIIKAGPITNFIQSLGEKMRVLTFYGVRRAESTQRADYNAVTVGAKIGAQVTASPVIDWLEFDIWNYIIQNNVLFNKSYRLGYSRVGCWLCPLNSTWSDFLNSIHFKEDNDEWQSYLVDFAKKIGKPDPEVYVKERKWAARHGGSGLQNRWTGIDIKPCGDLDNTIEIRLTKDINDDLLEFLKPMGKINYEISDPEAGIYYISKNGNAGHNLKVQAIKGSRLARVTALDVSEKEEIFRFSKYQFNKFQTCIQCTACSTACPHSAIIVRPEHDVYEVDEDKCINCNECITHFGSTGCLVAKSLSSYGKDRLNNVNMEELNKFDGLPNINSDVINF
ncbi:MAG: phosphoadenosine phosphosulfate reductase family protein, partial [Candidatus Heimdallarchaeota archaeon]|nr:phosphoadenosine phosphosulfate reductase family protein [Candidatus Heimdallarchaeota archaeon]